jgi:hypothetical protein
MPSLDGVYEKIERARVHQVELTRRLAAVLGRDKQSFTLDAEPEDGKYAFRVSGVPAVDPEWKTIVGDCLFNLRSALDHLAWQLVLVDGGQPLNRTSFPVRKAWDNKPLLIPQVSSCDILDTLEAVQPYCDTGDPPDAPVLHPLWALHRLNIIDKHRQLLVVVHTPNLGESWWGWDGDDELKPDFYLNRAVIRDDGTPVGWFSFPGGAPSDGFHPSFALHVVLNEQELPHLTNRGVQDVLQDTIFHVEHMVDTKFLPLFPDGSTTAKPRFRLIS